MREMSPFPRENVKEVFYFYLPEKSVRNNLIVLTIKTLLNFKK